MRSALRRIPFAAFGLKKYFSGTSPFSIASHNEDSLARLGDSEVFAVKHTPSDRIPEFGQTLNNGSEVSSVVGREEAWNVFDENNAGAAVLNQSRKLMKESRLLPSKPSPRPHSRQRDILAGESSCPDSGNRYACWVEDFLDVFPTRETRPVPVEDRPAEGVEFALVGDSEAFFLEAKVEPPNSGKERGDGERVRIFVYAGLPVDEWCGNISANRHRSFSGSTVSHAHTTTRFQPSSSSARACSASRATLRPSFVTQ